MSENVPFTELLNPDKTFKSPEELTKLLVSLGIDNPESREIVSSCYKGVSACILDVALQLIGNKQAAVYDGSYQEYSLRQLQEKAAPSNLKLEITSEGEGTLCPKGARVLVHYTGKLTDGTEFDSSHDRGKPLDFTVGVGQVIRGWDEAITQLKKGQKAVLTCPPELAYGAKGVPGVIPANATLIFDIELVDFKRA